MLRRLFVIVMSLIALIGCANGSAGAGGAVVTGVGTSTSGATAAASAPAVSASIPGVPTNSATTPADAAAGDEVPDGAPAAKPQLILEAGGLGIAVDDTRVEHLPFGTAARTVRTAVTRLLGSLTTTARACPQGTRTSSSSHGFELLFNGGRFVGWADSGASGRRLTTGDGIGVGITVAALEHSGTQVTLRRVAGGTTAEWSSVPGGLDGRATSTSPRGRVTLVSSGETCLPN